MRTILFLLFLMPLLFAEAQTETEIRTHYQEINQKITESAEQGYEGPLYLNEWVTNKHGRSWPAVGIYQETVGFWYDDDPNHLPASERDPKTVLQKVIVTRRSSALTVNEEYLFMNGRLVFFFSQESEEGKQWETRAWLNTKGIFKRSLKVDGQEIPGAELNKPDYADFKRRMESLIKIGRSYLDLFLKQMMFP
ncbi:MAG: hypothetical protein IPP31_04730 [Chitinophagaceae bacterium]|nr:hypothetical protein [Chitinophagaceae bacterium]